MRPQQIQPRHHPAAQYHDIRAVDMHQVDDANRQPPRLGPHQSHSLNLPHRSRRKHRSAIRKPSAPCCGIERRPRRKRLPTALNPAVADRAAWINRHMPDMRRHTPPPALQPSVHNRATTNPGTDGDKDHIRAAPPRAMHPLSIGRCMAVMVQKARQTDRRRNPVAQRVIAEPVNGRRGERHALHRIQWPRRTNPRRHHLSTLQRPRRNLSHHRHNGIARRPRRCHPLSPAQHLTLRRQDRRPQPTAANVDAKGVLPHHRRLSATRAAS